MLHGMVRALLPTISVVAVLSVSACAATVTPPREPSATPSPTSQATGDPAKVGEWASAGSPRVFLTLNADGTLIGFDGCNTHLGTWIDGESSIGLRFSGHTDAGCAEGVVPWLAESDGAFLDGTTMHLFGPTDSPTGELVKSAD